jgi:hypothetical protein
MDGPRPIESVVRAIEEERRRRFEARGSKKKMEYAINKAMYLRFVQDKIIAATLTNGHATGKEMLRANMLKRSMEIDNEFEGIY